MSAVFSEEEGRDLPKTAGLFLPVYAGDMSGLLACPAGHILPV